MNGRKLKWLVFKIRVRRAYRRLLSALLPRLVTRALRMAARHGFATITCDSDGQFSVQVTRERDGLVLNRHYASADVVESALKLAIR